MMLQSTIQSIGITSDNQQNFFVGGYSTPEDRHIALPYDLVLATDVDELNFLAARLEPLAAAEISELNAALQNLNGSFDRFHIQ